MEYDKKRQHPRYKAALPVELRKPGARALTRAQTVNLSEGGCYVEMTAPQEVSNEVEIVLWIGREKIQAQGIIVSNHPSFGNGIKFTYVPDDGKMKLQKFVDSLDPAKRGTDSGV